MKAAEPGSEQGDLFFLKSFTGRDWKERALSYVVRCQCLGCVEVEVPGSGGTLNAVSPGWSTSTWCWLLSEPGELVQLCPGASRR